MAETRVVDLSSGIAGAYCTKLLADAGAEVVKFEDPEGDWLRAWSASGAPIPPGEDGALFQYLACSKQSATADAGQEADVSWVLELIGDADAVVWSPGSRLADHAALSPYALREAIPEIVVTTITPFGLEGPWANRPATEFTLQAWSGGILDRGSPEGPPVHVAGQQGEWAAGLFAGIGLLASRFRTSLRPQGELVDVSMLESLAMWLFGYPPVTWWDMAQKPLRSARSINIPGVEITKDGWVGLMVGTGQQWLDFCVMVEHPEWMDDESLIFVTTRTQKADELQPLITEWTASRTTAEVRDLATALRIPNAPIGNGATIPTLEHFMDRGSFVKNPRGGFLQPDAPYRLHGVPRSETGPPPRLGEHNESLRAPSRSSKEGHRASGATPWEARPAELPLKGLRVLDFTALFSGPACSRLLAMLGAEVIHVESTKRLDLYRYYTTRPMTDEGWWEWSPGFEGLNTNKKGLTLDLQDERGLDIAHRLVGTCDIVMENYSPRVMENLGLGYERLRKIKPDVIMLRIAGFGLDGPWRDVPAFAPIIEDASGITWLTGFPDDPPQEAQSAGDPNASFHAAVALFLALEHRRRTGEGILVEAPMIDAAISIAAEQVIEYSAYGNLLTRDGNRGPRAVPQNLYRTGDTDEYGKSDCWIALAIANDDQWRSLRAALGDPAWARAPELATQEGRRLNHDSIDRELAAWCVARPGDEILGTLWPAGVPVGKVMPAHRQAEVPQLQARRFFEHVDHPLTGRAILHDTFPARFSHGPHTFNRAAAPHLGQHNRDILAEIGLSEEEIDELESDGVTGSSLPVPDTQG